MGSFVFDESLAKIYTHILYQKTFNYIFVAQNIYNVPTNRLAVGFMLEPSGIIDLILYFNKFISKYVTICVLVCKYTVNRYTKHIKILPIIDNLRYPQTTKYKHSRANQDW